MEIFPLPAEVATKRALRGEEEEELLSKHDGMTSSSSQTKDLQPLEPNISKDELYELYLAGKLYIEKERTHDKTVILRYLERIRGKVNPAFATCYDNIWDGILSDDILSGPIWKTNKRNADPFSKYSLFAIIGVLFNNNVYSHEYSLSLYSQFLETEAKAETLRPYLSRGLKRTSLQRIHFILENFGVGKK